MKKKSMFVITEGTIINNEPECRCVGVFEFKSDAKRVLAATATKASKMLKDEGIANKVLLFDDYANIIGTRSNKAKEEILVHYHLSQNTIR